MARYSIPTDQFDKWRKSVHGQAFAAGNPNAPTCNGCHGAHASTPPDASSVARACGRCHEDEMLLLRAEPALAGLPQAGARAVRRLPRQPRRRARERNHGRHGPGLHVHEVPRSRRQAEAGRRRHRWAAPERARSRRFGARRRRACARPGPAHVGRRLRARPRHDRGDEGPGRRAHARRGARPGRGRRIDQAVNDTLSLVADAQRARTIERRGYYLALALGGLLLVALILKARQLDRRHGQGVP